MLCISVSKGEAETWTESYKKLCSDSKIQQHIKEQKLGPKREIISVKTISSLQIRTKTYVKIYSFKVPQRDPVFNDWLFEKGISNDILSL